MKVDSNRDTLVKLFCIGISGLFALLVVMPFWNVLMDSVSAVPFKTGIRWLPAQFTLKTYASVVSQKALLRNYSNTIYRTVVGTSLCVAVTFLTAYPLSKRALPFRGALTVALIVTMYFSGGLIPQYLLYKDLGLINNRLVLVLPSAFSGYYVLVSRNFISGIPAELEESAKLDGANDVVIALRIHFPLIKPIIATIALWASVGLWNEWFQAMIYITDSGKQVVMVKLRNMLMEAQIAEMFDNVNTLSAFTAESIKAATIYVTILPILFAYPFAQRYFISGLTTGAVKG